MWTFECDGEALSGRKLWLRPGMEYVIGRATNALVNLIIPQKSISRVHLKIRVDNVPEGNAFKILARSTVTIVGQETRCGTRLDGESIGTGEVRELDGTEHTLHLAKYEPAFRIKWEPKVFSFSLSTKEKKEKKVMAQRQAKVEKFDMKTLEVFTTHTTHVVASKRNTAIGLQALVNGRFLVKEDYLDAIARVTSPDSGPDQKSLLEEDFDLHWPNPMDFVPPSGNEPNPREKEYFAPNPARQGIFEGWTVIFCEKVQYENFLGPITDGGGKLERFDLIPGETTARKLVDFVEKRNGGENTAIVRFRAKGPTEEWCNELSTQVSEILNLRMVEQNEFLDIILTCDPSRLRTPLQEEPVPRAPPSTEVPQAGKSEGKSEEGTLKQDVAMEGADSAPVRKPRRRLGGRTQQPTPKVEIMDLFSMPGDPLPAPAPAQSSQHQLYEIPETQQEGMKSPPRRSSQLAFMESNTKPFTQQPSNQTQLPSITSVTNQNNSNNNNNRKRSPDSDDDAEDPDLMNKLFPATAMMKRRKIELEEREAAERAENPPVEVIEDDETPAPTAEEAMKDDSESHVKVSKTPTKGGRKVKPENPILAATRANIKEEEDLKKKEEASAGVGELDEEAMKGIRGLGVVEYFEIKPRSLNLRQNAYGDESDRWDPKWNGRPNFKGFRRRADDGGGAAGGGMRSVRGRVIIPLVESTSSGMNDISEMAIRKAAEAASASEDEYPAEDTSLFRKPPGRQTQITIPSQRRHASGASQVQSQSQQASLLSSQTAGAGASSSRGDEDSMSLSGVRRRVSGESVTGAKRAMSHGLQEPASKRAKKFMLTSTSARGGGGSEDEDSDEEEDRLKFSFKKRGFGG